VPICLCKEKHEIRSINRSHHVSCLCVAVETIAHKLENSLASTDNEFETSSQVTNTESADPLTHYSALSPTGLSYSRCLEAGRSS
jgi:hypothetical protein